MLEFRQIFLILLKFSWSCCNLPRYFKGAVYIYAHLNEAVLIYLMLLALPKCDWSYGNLPFCIKKLNSQILKFLPD